MSRTIRIRPGVVLLGLAAAFLALLPGIAAAQVPASEVPDDLNAAIEAYIEGQGNEYAGLCEVVNADPDSIVPGTYCAAVISIDDDVAEVAYGLVQSDDISRVSFELQGGQWQVVESTPTATATATATATGGTPRPPATGTGGPEGDSSAPTLLLAGSLIVLAAFGAAGFVATRRR